MHKCPYADAYKAQRPPTCDGGKICDACKAKWNARKSNVALSLKRGEEAAYCAPVVIIV